VLKPVKQMGSSVSRLHTIWVDAGFEGEPFMQSVMNFCGWTRASGTDLSKPSLPGAQETLGSGANIWLVDRISAIAQRL